MKKFVSPRILVPLILLVIVACNAMRGPQGSTGSSCSVSQVSGGATVDCTDGSSVFIPNGTNGATGPTGASGTSGRSIVFQTVSVSPGSTCSAGGQTILIANDDAGTGVWTVSDSNQQSVTLCNGSNAELPSFTPSLAITPCGPRSSAYKEALLGLTGGGVYAEIITNLSNPGTIRNALLPDGSYYDTDDSECNFTISTDVSENRSITWDGSSADGAGPFSPGAAAYSVFSLTWSASYGPIGD